MSTKEIYQNEKCTSKDFIDLDEIEEDVDENNESRGGRGIDIEVNNLTKIEEENFKKIVDDLNINKHTKNEDNSKIPKEKDKNISYTEDKSALNFPEIDENFDDYYYEYDSKIDDNIFQEFKNREKQKFKAFLNEISQYQIKNYNEIINQSKLDLSMIEIPQNKELDINVKGENTDKIDKAGFSHLDVASPDFLNELNDYRELENVNKIFNPLSVEKKETITITPIQSIDIVNRVNNFEIIETVERVENPPNTDKTFLNGRKLRKINHEQEKKLKFSFGPNSNTNTSLVFYKVANFYPYNLTDEEIFNKFSKVKETQTFKKFITDNIKNANTTNRKSINNNNCNLYYDGSNREFINQIVLGFTNLKTKSIYEKSILKTSSTMASLKQHSDKVDISKYLSNNLPTSNSTLKRKYQAVTSKDNPIMNSYSSEYKNNNINISGNLNKNNLTKVNSNRPKNFNFPQIPQEILDIYKNQIKEERLKFLILREENQKLSRNSEAQKQKNEEAEKKLRVEIDYLKYQINGLEDENKFLTNKYTESKLTINKLNSDILERNMTIEELHSEISNNEKKFNNMGLEISYLKGQIESLKSELSFNKNENIKKSEKIAELQEKLFNLEEEANETRIKNNTEILNLRESKQNYDSLKTNYYETKNQHELLNMKYQAINDENFNLKRDLMLYEKEMRTKNETIQKLRNDLIESNKKNILSSDMEVLVGSGNINSNVNPSISESNLQTSMANVIVYNKNSSGLNSNTNEKNDIQKVSSNEAIKLNKYNENLKNFYSSENKNQYITYSGSNNYTNPNNNLALSKNNPEKESRLKIVEDQYFLMNNEREKVKNRI